MRRQLQFLGILLATLSHAPALHAQNTVALASNPATGPRFLRSSLPGASLVLDGALVRVGTINPLPDATEPTSSVAARFQEFGRTTMGTGSVIYANTGRLARTVTGSTPAADFLFQGLPICLLVYATATESSFASRGVFCSQTRFPSPASFGFSVNVNTFTQAGGGAQVMLAPGGTVAQFILNGGTLYGEYDQWLFQYFTSNSVPYEGDNADQDHDGQSNIMEYKAGTHPLQGGSSLQLSVSLPSATQASFHIAPVRFGLRYIIQTAGPGLNSWTDSPPVYFTADALQGTTIFRVSGPRAFFRLKLELPP